MTESGLPIPAGFCAFMRQGIAVQSYARAQGAVGCARGTGLHEGRICPTTNNDRRGATSPVCQWRPVLSGGYVDFPGTKLGALWNVHPQYAVLEACLDLPGLELTAQ